MYPNLTGPKMEIPDSPAVARKKILSIAELPALTVLPVTLEIQREALALCERHAVRKQRYFDMQIAATMIRNDIGTILTENTAGTEDCFQGRTPLYFAFLFSRKKLYSRTSTTPRMT